MPINYDTDGATLYYIDPTGAKITSSVFDGPRYSSFMSIMDAQLQAGRENAAAISAYNQMLANEQQHANNFTSYSVPAKPSQKVVIDTGQTTMQPFNPPLADLVIPRVTAPNAGIIAQPSVDKQEIMYSMLCAIFRKLFPPA